MLIHKYTCHDTLVMNIESSLLIEYSWVVKKITSCRTKKVAHVDRLRTKIFFFLKLWSKKVLTF